MLISQGGGKRQQFRQILLILAGFWPESAFFRTEINRIAG
jgi:hypothetical protein